MKKLVAATALAAVPFVAGHRESFGRSVAADYGGRILPGGGGIYVGGFSRAVAGVLVVGMKWR